MSPLSSNFMWATMATSHKNEISGYRYPRKSLKTFIFCMSITGMRLLQSSVVSGISNPIIYIYV